MLPCQVTWQLLILRKLSVWNSLCVHACSREIPVVFLGRVSLKAETRLNGIVFEPNSISERSRILATRRLADFALDVKAYRPLGILALRRLKACPFDRLTRGRLGFPTQSVGGSSRYLLYQAIRRSISPSFARVRMRERNPYCPQSGE